jgi:hypothetical protein
MKKTLLITPLLVALSSNLFAFGLSDAVDVASSTLNTQETHKKASTTKTKATDLTSTLVNSLGVTQKQADGGVGSILSYAQGSLPSNDYSKLASAIPNASSLVAMAPKASSSLGGLGALAKQGSSVASMAGLASQFSSLGMDSGMVSKFIPIIMDYFKGSGSTDAMSILGGLFK